jgi:hypothetical protein
MVSSPKQSVLNARFAVSARWEAFPRNASDLMVIGHCMRRLMNYVIDSGSGHPLPWLLVFEAGSAHFGQSINECSCHTLLSF